MSPNYLANDPRYQGDLAWGRYLLTLPSTDQTAMEDRIGRTDSGLAWLMRIRAI